ncbi:MAG: hypothetical protein CXZ00_00250 [Acidobacteria bacterium]|nr:MAG: hypothetical protein CXZ00_00250 [Acidobacteriota bacterium]
MLGSGHFVFSQGGRPVPGYSNASSVNTSTQSPEARKRFAYEAVRGAVAVTQRDPQDRLRVLGTAARVIAPIFPELAKIYIREGLRVEQALIQRGDQPESSMLNSGLIGCGVAQTLIENITVQQVDAADTTVVAAISTCPAVVASAQKLIEAGLQEKKLAPRATLALMEHAGLKSAWSLNKFEKLFDSLPMDAGHKEQEAPKLAAVYARAAGEVDRSLARKAGLRLLLWLGKLNDGENRAVAANVTTAAMKQALGPKEYEDALAGDVMARRVAQSSRGEEEVSHPMDQPASVLKATGPAKMDRIQELEEMPPARRAREAAASGFTTRRGGDIELGARYFDLAFNSLNAVWSGRENEREAIAVIMEVSGAAAQVDPIDALRRSRELDYPCAQAIGMIGVARVLATLEQNAPSSASR